MIIKGDILRIVPAWQDPGDDEFTWVARCDERLDRDGKDGRLEISTLEDSHRTIWPSQTVNSYMVEQTGKRIEAHKRYCEEAIKLHGEYACLL